MTVIELIDALAKLRSDIADSLRINKGVGGTAPLAPDNEFVVRAVQLGYQPTPDTNLYALAKAVESVHSQINIEIFRNNGASETAANILFSLDAPKGT